MVSDNSPDSLPPGWMEFVKVKNGRKTKYYSKAATGQKFYSKLAVMRYVNMPVDGVHTPRPRSETDRNQTPQAPIDHGKEASVSQVSTDGPDTNGSPVWLPPGWITEVKSRKGSTSTFKIYTDPATGKKFYSQPQVSRYLTALSHKEVPVERNQNNVAGKSASETNVSEHQVSVKKQGRRSGEQKGILSKQTSDVIESGSVDGLPVGWTKEIKIRHRPNGIKKDPYYTDPVSGYIFRSKKDALRYLDTGDINSCSMKPMKGAEPLPIAASYEDASSGDFSLHHIPMKVVNGEPLKSDQLQNTEVDGLPTGWIREIQTRKRGRGKDSFYIDPISGYMFRSKPDALRYIETGDISKCAIKPKKRDTNPIGSAIQASGDDACGQHISRRGRSSISNKEEIKTTNNSSEPVQIQTPADNGLPIGWTKEIQIRRDGVGKDYLYADPNSEYMFRSKKDALRYIETGDISKCTIKPKKRDVNDIGSKQQNDASQQLTSCKEQPSASKREENTISNYSGEHVQNCAVEGLPIGWTREIQIRRNGIGKDSFYIDPVSGYMFRSKMDALRYIETGDISKCSIKPKKRDANDTGCTKPGSSNDASQHLISSKDQRSASKSEKNTISNYSGEHAQNSAVEGLPIGWTREIQIRRDGIGKDSFYIDPVSGYMFRSKVDALRYIETGDITKCAIKPKKRDANGTGSSKQVSSVRPLTPVSRSNSVRSTSKKLLISEKSNSGGENCDASISKAVKSESSKRKRGSALPSDNGSPADSSTKRIVQSTPGRTSKRLAGCQPEMPNLQVSERDLRAAMKISCEDEASVLPIITMNARPIESPLPLHPEPTSVDANPSLKQELPKRIMKEKVRRNTPANSKNSNEAITPSTPGIASIQQTGSQSEFLSNEQLSGGSLCAELKKSSEDEAHVFPWIDINDVPDVVPQTFQTGLSTNNAVGISTEYETHPLDTEPASEVSDIVSMVVQSISSTDVRQKNAETSTQQINDKQDPGNSKPQDDQGGYQFVDPLPNPFMNFTYSNATIVTPDESNLAYQGFSQQQTNNPFFQGNEYSGWSGSQNLGYSQNGNPSHTNSVSQQAHVQQFSSTFVTPGFGYPPFGSSNTQQPTSDNRNNTPGFVYPSYGSQQPTPDNRNNTTGFGYPFGSSGSQQPTSDNRNNNVYKRNQ